MTRFKGRRARLAGLLAVALGALTVFVLPGLASARNGGGDGPSASTATIESFDQATKTLVVTLPDGQTVTGTVSRRTKIRCEDQHANGRRGHSRVRGREAEPGDDRGGHGNEAGDDHGGHGNEPGDDHGGGNSGSGNSGVAGAPSSGGHDDNGRGANCSTADLLPGAVVDEVELDFEHGGVRFDEVELAR